MLTVMGILLCVLFATCVLVVVTLIAWRGHSKYEPSLSNEEQIKLFKDHQKESKESKEKDYGSDNLKEAAL